MYGYGCIVLRGFLKRLSIDGTIVELQGGFRGFDAVPPGRHEVIFEPDSERACSIELDLPLDDAIACEVQYDEMIPIGLVEIKPPESNRYRQLALSGAMGFALWTYPDIWQTIKDFSVIEGIFTRRNRLNFLLSQNYGLKVEDIQNIRIAPNVVEFRTAKRNFSFKLCPFNGDPFSLQVFMPVTDLEYTNSYEQKLDPAVWQALNELIVDWGNWEELGDRTSETQPRRSMSRLLFADEEDEDDDLADNGLEERHLLKAAIDFLKEDDWSHKVDIENEWITIEHQGENGKIDGFFSTYEVSEKFFFYTEYPHLCPESRLQAMAEFLTRANCGLAIGNFEMDFDDGSIRYKTSLDLEGIDIDDRNLSYFLIANIVYNNLETIDGYLPAIQAVIEGTSPKEAIALVEEEEEEEEEELWENELDKADIDDTDGEA